MSSNIFDVENIRLDFPILDKKVNGKELMIHKEKGKFCTYIDREKLDTYPTLGMAKKAGTEFIKAAKK